jgi:hypothetical protein
MCITANTPKKILTFQMSTTASKQGTVALPEHNASYIFHQPSKKITINIQKETRT